MLITPQAVAAYKTLMMEPKENGLDFPPISEVFRPSEQATAKHILFQQYVDLIKKPLPKIMFYIIMDSMYPQAHAADGNLGYCVTIATKKVEPS